MKQSHQKPPIDPAELRDAAVEIGVELDIPQAEKLVQHLTMVLHANETMNLTRITDASTAVRLHILDSLAVLPLVEELRGPVVDLGSGAGYPGIPLAVVTGQAVILCESVQKKARFLEEVVRKLQLDAVVVAERVEAYARRAPGSAGTIVARAVSALPSLVELASPLLVPGGRLLALKGIPDESEVARADTAARLCGMKLTDTRRYELAGGGEQRSIYVFTRDGSTQVALPRREGLAQRQPLA